MVPNPVKEGVENVRFDRLVRVTPCDPVFGFAMGYEEAVIGRAAGSFSGGRHECTVRGKHPFLTGDRVLDQLGRTEAPVHLRRFLYPGETFRQHSVNSWA